MLCTVEPHDLVAACTRCGTTIEEVSRETGILEEELLRFAAGQLALSARDRLCVFLALTRKLPPLRGQDEPLDLDLLMSREKLMNEVYAEACSLRDEEDYMTKSSSIH